MTLGAYHTCKIVDSIRIDDGEYMGSELDINREGCLSERDSLGRSIEAILDLPYNNKAKWQIANDHGRSWHSQMYFFLKYAVLSCTYAELQEVLREYMQTQAHEQAMMLKAELLEHIHSAGKLQG